MDIRDTTPLGLTQIYNSLTQTTQICWSYIEDAPMEYFVLELWDEYQLKWVPYDGKAGIIERQR